MRPGLDLLIFLRQQAMENIFLGHAFPVKSFHKLCVHFNFYHRRDSSIPFWGSALEYSFRTCLNAHNTACVM